MIEARKISKRFGLKRVLHDLDFKVPDGGCVALLGPNGSGKTTLLRILASLTKVDEGEVWIDGYRLSDQAALARGRVGFVSHQPLLYGDLTAKENLQFYGRMYGISDIQQRTAQVLELVGLYPRQADLVRTFSRGMGQRLAIARAILHQPQVLLFDEPHTGLDPDSVSMLDNILLDMSRQGHTLVISSHDPVHVADLVSRFDVLSEGELITSKGVEEIGVEHALAFYRDAVMGKGERRG
ncbi:MAG: heme ABC exporter ATP-binding protein CcmA [Anaerolineales bacterium]